MGSNWFGILRKFIKAIDGRNQSRTEVSNLLTPSLQPFMFKWNNFQQKVFPLEPISSQKSCFKEVFIPIDAAAVEVERLRLSSHEQF